MANRVVPVKSFSTYFSQRCILVYVLGILAIVLAFSRYIMPWYWMTLSLFTIIAYFAAAVYLTSLWLNISSSRYEKQLFWTTVLLRLIWIIVYYLITESLWNTPWEQPIGSSMDSIGYYNESKWILELLERKEFGRYITYIRSGSISDVGYPAFLALIGSFTKNGILIERFPNAFFDAYAVLLVYRLAKRNFDEYTARLAAVCMLLMPTAFFFAATTMKESIMVMLMLMAIDRGDILLRTRDVKLKQILPLILCSLSLFLFRTVLAIVVILSFMCALVLTSDRIRGKNKKMAGIMAVIIMIVMIFSGSFAQQFESLSSDLEKSESNFEYRASRKGGNSLVAGINKMELAPLIFTLPFPTMVDVESQQVQQIQNPGNYVKNILSFFCILALCMLLLSKEWKENVLIISCLVGYLVVLCFSSYAHAVRFHMPAIPFEMIFAAYGITHFNKPSYKHLFNIFLVLEFIILIGWNWFKLKGKGMI